MKIKRTPEYWSDGIANSKIVRAHVTHEIERQPVNSPKVKEYLTTIINWRYPYFVVPFSDKDKKRLKQSCEKIVQSEDLKSLFKYKESWYESYRLRLSGINVEILGCRKGFAIEGVILQRKYNFCFETADEALDHLVKILKRHANRYLKSL